MRNFLPAGNPKLSWRSLICEAIHVFGQYRFVSQMANTVNDMANFDIFYVSFGNRGHLSVESQMAKLGSSPSCSSRLKQLN